MNQLLFQRSWLFRLCRAFWWFFVFPCCFFYCLIVVVVAMFRDFGRCCCSCSFSSLRIVLCHFVQLSGWCFFGLGHFRCCHQEHRNSLRDCGMCCQPSLQMGSPGGLFYYLERVYWNISILHVLLQLFAIRSFQMLVFLKVLGFTMEGAKNPICRWSVGRLHSSLKHDSRTKSTWWIPLVVQLWMGKLQIVAWVIIKRSPTSTVAWIVKTHGWKQNERPTVCKEILPKLPYNGKLPPFSVNVRWSIALIGMARHAKVFWKRSCHRARQLTVAVVVAVVWRSCR